MTRLIFAEAALAACSLRTTGSPQDPDTGTAASATISAPTQYPNRAAIYAPFGWSCAFCAEGRRQRRFDRLVTTPHGGFERRIESLRAAWPVICCQGVSTVTLFDGDDEPATVPPRT